MDIFDVDFAIITALPIETIATLSVFWDEEKYGDEFISYKEIDSTNPERIPNTETPSLFHLGHLKNDETGQCYSVLVCKTTTMGSGATTELFTKLKERWNPRFFILTGISMSFDLSKANLGDVVVSEKILADRSDKITKTKVQRNVVSVPLNSKFHSEVFKQLKKINLDLNWKNPKHENKVIKGTFYSSNHVIASDNFRDELVKTYHSSGLIAGEMEALGFFGGRHSYKGNDPYSKNIIMVKGISDDGGDSKQDTVDRFIAARNAAYVCKTIIKSGEFFEPAIASEQENHSHSILSKYEKADSIDYYTWLSDYQRMQGLFRKAYLSLKDVWKSLTFDTDNINKQKIVEIAWRLAILEQERGNVEECLKKLMLANHCLAGYAEDKVLEIQSQVYFILGKVALDVEMLKNSNNFFKRSCELAEQDENPLGVFNSNRWQAYSKFRKQNYKESYLLLSNSLKEFLEADVYKDDMVYYSLAECIDMMSRCLREEAMQEFSVKNFDSGSELEKIDKKIRQGILLNRIGSLLARKSGNYFKIAESDLTFLYYYYHKPIRNRIPSAYANFPKTKLPKIVEEALGKYGFSFDLSAIEKEPLDFRLVINEGVSISKDFGYKLLEYTFCRLGNTIYQENGELEEAYTKIIEQVQSVLKPESTIRAQERYRTFFEFNQFISNTSGEIINEAKEEMMKFFLSSDIRHKDTLFPLDFFQN